MSGDCTATDSTTGDILTCTCLHLTDFMSVINLPTPKDEKDGEDETTATAYVEKEKIPDGITYGIGIWYILLIILSSLFFL